MSETRTTVCTLDCPDSCSLDVTLEEGRVVRLDGSSRNPVTADYICGKVRRFPEHVYHPLRIARPRIRTGKKGSGTFRDVSWDEALELVASRMRDVARTSGGEAILPYSDGGSNGYLTQDTTDLSLFARLGASRLQRSVCAAPTGAAAAGMYGKMAGVSYEDYPQARAILFWGVNSGVSGIHLMPYLKRAREAGAQSIVVDPRRTKLARQADLHVAPRPGTDLPLALAVIRWFFETGQADEAFLAAHASGAEELRRRAEPWTLERAAMECGIDASEIERLAEAYADASPAVLRCGWGLERNRNGCSAVSAVLALPAVAGKFGVRGGGYTMSNSSVWQLAPAVPDRMPRTRLVNMNRLGRALLGEEGGPAVELLFVYNANPLVTTPDQERIRRGLEREDLFTVVFDQVATDTTRYADVVLPATTFLEHVDLQASYGTLALQLCRPVIERFEEARPNYEVFGELLERTGLRQEGDTSDPWELLDRLTAEQPGLRAALEADGIVQPEIERPVQFVDAFPRTPDRRAHLVSAALDAEAPDGLYAYAADPGGEAHPLALLSPATSRTINSTLGQLFEGESPLHMHPDDARARGLADGDPVRVHNPLGEVRTSLRLDDSLRPGVVELSKGIWCRNTANGATANALAPDSLSDVAGGACFNDARVQVERVGS